MASEHKEALKAAPGAKPPLDDTFEKLMHDPRINVHLIAMPKVSHVNPSPKRPAEGGSEGKPGGPKKPKQNGSGTQLPEALTGLHRKTAAGKPLCWHYNLSKGCSNPVKQERCRFGMHHCMKCLKAGLVLEVFAGTCRFSKACRNAGLRVLAIDKDPKRSENFPVAQFDLTKQHDYDCICNLIDAEKSNLVAAHFAPSCGTASKAREKRVPGVSNAPRPLRSESYPDGLQTLTERERLRVEEANASYAAMVQLILLLVSLNVAVSIENPLNSLFWLTSFVVKLLQQVRGHFTVLQHCMHGGQRDKKSKFWSFNPRAPNENFLESLGLLCDGSHAHKSWKPRWVDGKLIFPTAEEAAYPELLCKRLASVVFDEAGKRGLAPLQTLRQQLHADNVVGKRNIFTMQARGNKLKPLVTEWGVECTVLAPVHAQAESEILKKIPKGSKVLQRHVHWGFNRDDWRSRDITFAEGLVEGGHYEALILGVPREPMQFIHDAVTAGHPKNAFARVSPLMRDVLREVFLRDPVQVRTKRMSFLKKWMRRAIELKSEENAAHDKLPDHLKPILAKKKLLLWREILIDLEYPDYKVIDEAMAGFPLTGWSQKSGVFETLVRPPENSVKQLEGMAKGLNMAVVSSLQNAEWQQIDEVAWTETLGEVERGWLGVEDCPDFSAQFFAKRFPIVQTGKTRLIDDFTINGVNSAYGMSEKLRIDSIDEVMACLSILLDNVSSGQKLSGVLGRTFDLKAAYKQFGVDSAHAEKLRIAVKKPGGGVGYFKVFALPLGATGSVASSLRLAASISYIGLKGLILPWTSFFDDFTALAPVGSQDDTTFFAEGLFKLLGLDFAAEGSKAPPFSNEFRTLGLLVKTAEFLDGKVELGHTPERREELLDLLSSLKVTESIPVKQLEQLHGRLVWFRSFVFGRKLNSATRVLSWYSRRPTTSVRLDDKLAGALATLEKHLRASTNVVISRDINKTWLIFTDGAFEPDHREPATIGGILVNPQSKVVSFFGAALSESLLEEFLAESKHPIYELEIFPLIVAVRAWSKFLRDQLVVHYLDNDAARSSFVRADAGIDLGRTAPWLAGAQHYPLILPSRLSQWGIGQTALIQQVVMDGQVQLMQFPTVWNLADVGTKSLGCTRLRLLVRLINVASNEGADSVGDAEYEVQTQKHGNIKQLNALAKNVAR
eukprot:s673_g21.t1